MVHEYGAHRPNFNVAQLRAKHPDAAIIRQEVGRSYVFDTLGDALGHHTGKPDLDAIRRAKN